MLKEKYERKVNESEEDFISRICSYRLEDGLQWMEIANFLNAELGYNYSESKYRKAYAREQAAYYQGLAEADTISPAPAQEEKIMFTPKERELRERYQGSVEKMPYYRVMRQDARFERFYQLVADQIKELPVPDYIGLEPTERSEETQYVLTLADLHIGANFRAVNNTYSMEEAARRFGVLLTKTIDYIQSHGITHLSVLSLGDVVQGILRISDLKLNEASVVDALVCAMRLIADFLNKLSKYVYIDFYQVCYSNHDQLRPLGTKASELGTEDMGKILYAYLTDTLKSNERISITGDVDNNYLEFKVFNFNCIAMHGHQVKNVSTLYKDLATRHHKFYDYIFLGHTHSTKEFVNAEGSTYDCETLVTGSFCGSDPYADSLFVGSKASAKIYEFDRLEGLVGTHKFILN